VCDGQSARFKARYDQEARMTTSLRILSLLCALAATSAPAGAASMRAATNPPALASDTGWPTELVNRPNCGSDGDYEARPACEAVRR
jgi:hypothetical protein